MTRDYVVMASDRQVTWIWPDGTVGDMKDSDTCKLINFCNYTIIGYSGIAEIDNLKMYEWILKQISDRNCTDTNQAGKILKEQASLVLRKYDSRRKHHEFLMAGWNYFKGLDGLRPFFSLITNCRDDYGRKLVHAKDNFSIRLRALRDGEEFLWKVIGADISKERQKRFYKDLKPMIMRRIGPKEILKYIVNEIIYTADNQRENEKTVGKKILAACIPKNSVVKQIETGHWFFLAKWPDNDTATFSYFDNGYNELFQFGPAMVFGKKALTNITTETDSKRDFQSSQATIFRL